MTRHWINDRYGIGPSAKTLEDVRAMNLFQERLLMYGPIPAGVTLYRKGIVYLTEHALVIGWHEVGAVL